LITDQDIAERRLGIGSSDVFYILGAVDKYKTDRDLWAFKTGRSKDDPTVSFAATWGNLTETAVAKIEIIPDAVSRGWLEEGAVDLVRGEDGAAQPGPGLGEPETMVHPDHSWARANCDRLLLDADGVARELYEIKVLGSYRAREFGESWSGVFPDAYRKQIVWQMHIARSNGHAIDRGYLVAVLDNRGATWNCIEYDEEEALELFEFCYIWWMNFVLADEIPPHKGRREDVAAASRLYQEVQEETELEADKELEELAAKYKALELEIEELQDDLCGLLCDIKDRAGNFDRVYGAGFTIDNRFRKPRTSTSWKSVALAMSATEEAIAANTKTSEGKRQFSIKFNSAEGG